MRDYLRLFGRGFLIVALTSANVRQIAGGHYLHALVVGFGISYVWWFNSRSAAHSDLPLAGFVYAMGAGLGTLTGMYLGNLGR